MCSFDISFLATEDIKANPDLLWLDFDVYKEPSRSYQTQKKSQPMKTDSLLSLLFYFGLMHA